MPGRRKLSVRHATCSDSLLSLRMQKKHIHAHACPPQKCYETQHPLVSIILFIATTATSSEPLVIDITWGDSVWHEHDDSVFNNNMESPSHAIFQRSFKFPAAEEEEDDDDLNFQIRF